MLLRLLLFVDVTVVANGVDAPNKWTGSGNFAALGGSPPTPKFIQEYKTYLVCANIAGGTDITQRIQWSDTADPETWDSGNAGAVDLVEDAFDITGLSVYGNYLTVHKESCIYLGYLISTTDIFKFERKNTGVGTIANNSIVNIPTGEQLFLAKDGLRVFNGISAPLIESPINDEIRDSLNSQYMSKAWGLLVKDKDEAWIGIPMGTSQSTGETIFKYNYKNKTILKDIRANACAAWTAEITSNTSWDDYAGTWDDSTDRWNGKGLNQGDDLINIGKTDGTTPYVDTTALNDSGVTIVSEFETKDFSSSTTGTARWTELEVWAKGGTVRIQYSIDKGLTWNEPAQSPLTLDDDYPSFNDPDIIYFDIVSTYIRFKFTNSESDETLSVKQCIVKYKNREERQ